MRERSKRMKKAVADPGNEESASPLRWEIALKDHVERAPALPRALPSPWHACRGLPLPRRRARRPLCGRAHHAHRRSPDMWGPGREAVHDVLHGANSSQAMAPKSCSRQAWCSWRRRRSATCAASRSSALGSACACSPRAWFTCHETPPHLLFRAMETTPLLPGGQVSSLDKPTSDPASCLFPSLV